MKTALVIVSCPSSLLSAVSMQVGAAPPPKRWLRSVTPSVMFTVPLASTEIFCNDFAVSPIIQYVDELLRRPVGVRRSRCFDGPSYSRWTV